MNIEDLLNKKSPYHLEITSYLIIKQYSVSLYPAVGTCQNMKSYWITTEMLGKPFIYIK